MLGNDGREVFSGDISTSEGANPNYLCKIVRLEGVSKHPNADKLQVVNVDFQSVVTGMDAKDGDLYVFFPLESQINAEFLSATNAFRHKELNADKEQAGFFEDNRRVRAVKLRGVKSMGYIVPLHIVEHFTGKYLGNYVGLEFDTIGDKLMVNKYVIRVKEPRALRLGKKPRISRLVEGQVRLHVDTEQLRKNAFEVNPDDHITITYKYHGTSWWVSHALVKRPLNVIEKVLRKIGVKIDELEYDYVYGSRRVVKNEYETSQKEHFYDTDIWGEIKDELKEIIPKGYTLYGEAVGFTKSGAYIQDKYDYGCEPGTKKLLIYRITSTNADGVVIDLSSEQIHEFCKARGLVYVDIFYSGPAKGLFPEIKTDDTWWHKNFVEKLEEKYLETDCFICKNKVPNEGIVLRKETLFEFKSYKLKSFRFLELETEMLDKGVEDIESTN